MNNPFIPKDNYITRILDKLEEERLWRVLENHAKGLEVDPKDLKVIFSDNGIIHKAPPSIFLMWYKKQMNDLHNQFQRDWIKTFGK